MKSIYTYFAIVTLFITHQARAGVADAFGLDFSAPAVPSANGITGQPAGTIIFDLSTNRFLGLDSKGVWQTMTSGSSSSQVVSTSPTQRIERARIEMTPSTCSIVSESGDWLDSANFNADGDCTFTFEENLFSGDVDCTATMVTNSTGFLDGLLSTFFRHVSDSSFRIVSAWMNKSAGSLAASVSPAPSTFGNITYSVTCMGNTAAN